MHGHILVAGGDKGLWTGSLSGKWLKIEDCPPSPTRLAIGGGKTVCVSGSQSDIWNLDSGKHLGGCPGLEAMAVSPDGAYVYLLSGEGDSVMCLRADTGEPLYLNHVGVYPRDMRLHPRGNMLVVAAGTSASIEVLSAPQLRLMRSIPVPGVAYQAAFVRGGLAVMLAAEDGEVHTLLGHIRDDRGTWEEVMHLPGLPGALCPMPDGTVVASVLDAVVRASLRPRKLIWRYVRQGLPVHIDQNRELLLISDSLMETVSVLDAGQKEQIIWQDGEGFGLWYV